MKLRELLSTNKELAYKLKLLENRTEKHEGEIKAIFGAPRQLMEHPDKKMKVVQDFGGEKDGS